MVIFFTRAIGKEYSGFKCNVGKLVLRYQMSALAGARLDIGDGGHRAGGTELGRHSGRCSSKRDNRGKILMFLSNRRS